MLGFVTGSLDAESPEERSEPSMGRGSIGERFVVPDEEEAVPCASVQPMAPQNAEHQHGLCFF